MSEVGRVELSENHVAIQSALNNLDSVVAKFQGVVLRIAHGDQAEKPSTVEQDIVPLGLFLRGGADTIMVVVEKLASLVYELETVLFTQEGR